MKSKKSRKPHYDTSTKDGRVKLSQLRNRGADRLLGRIKRYQKKTLHKVLVNFLPTWKAGKPRVWHSHHPENITPVFKDEDGDIRPFSRGTAIEESTSDESDQEYGKPVPSGSTRMRKKSAAVQGSKEKKRDFKLKCGHCCTGPGLEDLHPLSPWIRCGEKRCKSENFTYHAVCHGVRVLKRNEKTFNEKYSRCKKHFVKQVKVSNLSGEGSDMDDFRVEKRKTKNPTEHASPVSKKKRNKAPVKVLTPGAKDLPPIKKKKEMEPRVKEDSFDDDSKDKSGDDCEVETQDDNSEKENRQLKEKDLLSCSGSNKNLHKKSVSASKSDDEIIELSPVKFSKKIAENGAYVKKKSELSHSKRGDESEVESTDSNEQDIDDVNEIETDDDSAEESDDDFEDESDDDSEDDSDDDSDEEKIDHDVKQKGGRAVNEKGDHGVNKKGRIVNEKDRAIKEKDLAVNEKDRAVKAKDRAVKEKNGAEKEKDRAEKEKDRAEKEKDSSHSSKNLNKKSVFVSTSNSDDEFIDLTSSKSSKPTLKEVAMDAAKVKKKSKISRSNN